MSGITGSNYAGTNANLINPSFASNLPLKWELHLVTMGMNFDNNFVGISALNDVLNPPPVPADTSVTTFNIANELAKYGLVVSDFDRPKFKYLHMNFVLRGPSLMIKINKKHSFGFHNAMRMGFRFNHFYTGYIPAEIDSNLQYQGAYEFPKFRINMLAFSELGFTYSGIFQDNNSSRIQAGATVKLLSGMFGTYILNRKARFEILPNDDVEVNDFHVKYGYIDPATFNNLPASPGFSDVAIGKGLGVDIGGTYIIKNRGARANKKKKVDYQFRLGASVIDVGRIKFNGGKSLEIDRQNIVFNQFTTTGINSPGSLDSALSNNFYGNPTQSLVANNMKMWLPMALSVQVDYNIWQFFYINTTIIQRIPYGAPGLYRANVITATPRFETLLFELGVPMMLYEYQYPRLGAYVRLWGLTIGSDYSNGLMGLGNIWGMNAYMSLKITPFGKRNKKKKKTSGCPMFF
ncbi:MAG: hypothetical protein IIA45_08475 [Bacteroidetes bacterium]|nr:hypothetical protein [Bacteroidota bacterium]